MFIFSATAISKLRCAEYISTGKKSITGLSLVTMIVMIALHPILNDAHAVGVQWEYGIVSSAWLAEG